MIVNKWSISRSLFILNMMIKMDNATQFYLLKTYQMILDAIENLELIEIAKARLREKGEAIKVNLEDL